MSEHEPHIVGFVGILYGCYSSKTSNKNKQITECIHYHILMVAVQLFVMTDVPGPQMEVKVSPGW
ncbi:hypothetical protein Deipr_1100 [Deinococcus proteolyticus MRP]|uniref:Uncharacterized protein n=1 Tax=Deinococcus proteolyticus (strain ATCC 35074 / DSM 20540 / JCM 6276 / NBRC 101906 / NCIMB 13154 / VKM Ac-1939 / CCM 2703 / MRP) TaxID=693977 RepID=F0RNB0_DEIPM|nr:hypothetical protein Deipr_1100 [Deinococcus proteolyticus MRP]